VIKAMIPVPAPSPSTPSVRLTPFAVPAMLCAIGFALFYRDFTFFRR